MYNNKSYTFEVNYAGLPLLAFAILIYCGVFGGNLIERGLIGWAFIEGCSVIEIMRKYEVSKLQFSVISFLMVAIGVIGPVMAFIGLLQS